MIDVCLMNPPYNRSLHLNFLEKTIEIANNVVSIQPVRWLISQKQSGKFKQYKNLRDTVEGYVKSIDIFNGNKIFNINLYVPCGIFHFDFNKKHNNIDFNCFNENKKVSSIYDCNLIGNYNLISSIFKKINNYDKMCNHIYKEGKTQIDENTYFCSYQPILGRSGCCDPRTGDVWFVNDHYNCYYLCCFNYREDIKHTPIHALKNGRTYTNPEYSDKLTANLYGTKTELENWKHFILNNSLSLFINIVLTIEQNANSENYMPWVVDKQYTDDELYKLFNISKEEQKLIEDVIDKYSRNSEWFKLYVYGNK